MEPNPITATPGTPDKLGAAYDGAGVNFAIYSKHAERMELCLFDAEGKTETARIDLPQKTGDVWHGYLPGLKPGQVYGFRAHGPLDPQAGPRFNPNKLLLDPYATEVAGEVKWTADQTNPEKDSAPATLKARVTEPLPAVTRQTVIPDNRLRILEAHVRGYSMLDPKIPPELRGTIEGLACDASIDYLKNELHVNVVEVNPAQAKLHDFALTVRGLKNYWGYNQIGFFAPEPEYVHDKVHPREAFRAAVEKLDKNDIKVILDVVFNHAGEGDDKGPTISFRGIDNESYYKLDPADKSKYIDNTGCGNTLDLGNPMVRKFVLDSLRLWVTQYGIAGFRFDLAPVLGRDPYAFDKQAAFFKEIAADPVLSKVILIAEPWDPGSGGYQLGNFPAGWKEWNDRFRDDVRRYWRGDYDTTRQLATRLAGSAPEFETPGRKPQDSVNFVTCHDGFTLHDLVSYTSKKNIANGEDNRDGANENYSANYGAEGDTKDPFIIAVREQQKRNLLATLFLAQGTPMMLAGDEHGNTQQGNNNAYCQDNPIGWLAWAGSQDVLAEREGRPGSSSKLADARAGQQDPLAPYSLPGYTFDWKDLTPEAEKLGKFTRRLTEFRDSHEALLAPYFMHGQKKCDNGIPDLSWVSPAGAAPTDQDWNDGNRKCLGMLLNEAAITGKKGGERLLAVFNSAANSVSFKMPSLKGGTGWTRVLDTAHPEDPEDKTAIADGKAYDIPARSVVVFTQKPGQAP